MPNERGLVMTLTFARHLVFMVGMSILFLIIPWRV